MKKSDYWKSFTSTGRIDDYLHYTACTREEGSDELILDMDRSKEGGLSAGIDYSDGDGFVGHASW